MYLSDLKIPYFLYSSSVSIKVISMGATKVLKCFKDAGNYDAPFWEWKARPVAAQTYPNLKTMMSIEYSKLNRQDYVIARATGHASVNVME
jgi:hypothetical protein